MNWQRPDGSERAAARRDAALVALPVAVAVTAAALTGIAALGLLGTLVATAMAIRAGGGMDRAWPTLGLAPPRSPALMLAVGTFGAAVLHLVLSRVVMPVASDLVGAPDLSAFTALVGNELALGAALALAWATAAFGEEIVFRGSLLPRLALAFGGEEAGWVTAFVVVTLGFGLAHLYQGPAGMVGTAVAGILFGLLRRQRADGLWPAVLAHGIYDSYGLTTVYLGHVA